MINLKETLARDIQEGMEAAQKSGALPKGALPKVLVRHMGEADKGDYASPVALGLAKKWKRPAMELLTALVAAMPKKEYVGKLEAAEPGFLNIWLNPGWMTARLHSLLEEDLCGEIAETGKGRNVNLEFVSANPTGPLTLGNCRTAFSADTLGNVLKCVGYNVIREYYFNDAGSQVQKLGQSVLRRILQSQGEAVDFPEELYQGEYIKELGAQIAAKWKEDEGKTFTRADLESAEVVDALSREAVRIQFERIKKTLHDDLHIEFDVWTSEAQIRESGAVESVLASLKKKGEVYEKDGAWWLKTTNFGDDQDRVLVKKDGEFAYIMPDIAYHLDKYARGFDLIFTFLGADHQGHIPKLKAAMQALGHDPDKLHFVVAQWLRLVQGGKLKKVSKRAGTIVTPQDLLQEVGYDAARFFLVQHRLDTHMDFDLDLAKERSERNPVYYVQYAHVRLASILRRAKEQGAIMDVGETASHAALTHTFEVAVMRDLYRFPEVIAEIGRNFAVHDLTYYVRELAQSIHAFYKQVPVLTADEKLVASRLQLVSAARAVLSKTLDILGVSKPEVM